MYSLFTDCYNRVETVNKRKRVCVCVCVCVCVAKKYMMTVTGM